MVIAFYPGSGGNRYLRMLQNLEWQQSQISYDSFVTGQTFTTRYLFDDIKFQPKDYVLTHCMNATHIQKKFPGRDICFIIGDLKQCLQREWALCGHDRYVKKIAMDINRVEHYNAFKDPKWPICNTKEEIDNLPTDMLKEIMQDFNNIPKNIISNIGVLETLEKNFKNKVNSAYDTIKWHKEYYSRYPVEYVSGANVINISTDNNIFSTTMRNELNKYCSDVFSDVWDALNV